MLNVWWQLGLRVSPAVTRLTVYRRMHITEARKIADPNTRKQYGEIGRFFIDIFGLMNSFGLSLFVGLEWVIVLQWIEVGAPGKSI